MMREYVLFITVLLSIICLSYAQLFESTVRQMWITPIQLYNLTNTYIEINNYNTNIMKLLLDLNYEITKSFIKFRDNKSLKKDILILYDLDEDALDSDLYFYHQQQPNGVSNSNYCSDDCIKQYDIYLTNLIYESIYRYSNENHLKINNFQRSDLLIWASIHANGSFHNSHHHQGSAISGVIYLNIPDQSGSIFFEDPRGKLPPFGNVMKHKPSFGDMILFPGWLVHGVMPSYNTIPRVSISFNYFGSWTLTSDISLAYNTE